MIRRWVVILGDQLDAQAEVLRLSDPQQDRIWMAEARQESTHVPSSKTRTVLFLSAMRHFAQHLRDQGWTVDYQRIDDPNASDSLGERLALSLKQHPAQEVWVTAPGEWRVLQMLRDTVRDAGLSLQVQDDTHFYTTVRDFARHAQGRKQLRMEFWYRELRQRFGVLMNGDQPEGERWNFDADNRASFGQQGPGVLPALPRFEPDAITRDVMQTVKQQLPDLPGSCDAFNWPVTRAQALQALADFVAHRLALFGQFEDAMWLNEPVLYHSQFSAAMNLKLIGAREVVDAVEQAYRQGRVPLAAAEGYIRQVLGWREYVRGVYWTRMPEYA